MFTLKRQDLFALGENVALKPLKGKLEQQMKRKLSLCALEKDSFII